MYEFRALVVGIALAGAVLAALAAVGKWSGRLGDRIVDRLYYVSYGCTAFSVLLFIMRGLFAGRG
jgi:hypothetical protein